MTGEPIGRSTDRSGEARRIAGPIGTWFRPEDSFDCQLICNPDDDIDPTFDAVNFGKSKQQNYYLRR